ncbi:dihydrofolate reductase [Haliovirga abyssi]|uniref:Dihydrofolate reductase n=1 Tax=Haliovirga abyssi TaxID=2996794 RepID=A0AAU9DH81_9FUSO|nr:dihydrofolate reductase [Haliovirga abyssi]BDU51653.1 dihydrofolate reductase [Haliovirga abyssi]
MSLILVAAMSKNKIIGKNGKMPWDIKEDLKKFKEITLNKTVVMGRITYESIGRKLPQRENIILTRDKNYKKYGCIIIHSFNEILEMSKTKDIYIIGGGNLYSYFIKFAEKIYLTYINKEYSGDTFFPEIKKDEWEEIENLKRYSEEEEVDYYFKVLVRKI